jgi:hypothetical protein
MPTTSSRTIITVEEDVSHGTFSSLTNNPSAYTEEALSGLADEYNASRSAATQRADELCNEKGLLLDKLRGTSGDGGTAASQELSDLLTRIKGAMAVVVAYTEAIGSIYHELEHRQGDCTCENSTW